MMKILIGYISTNFKRIGLKKKLCRGNCIEKSLFNLDALRLRTVPYSVILHIITGCTWSVSGDYKEGYYIGVEVPEDNPEANKPFYGPNQWPTEGVALFPFF